MTESFNPFSLQGKHILITGASSGIGRQCAVNCDRMGARLLLVGRNKSRLVETLGMLSGSDHDYVVTDLNKIPPTYIEELVTLHGAFDGFVHSAGIEKTVPVKFLKKADYVEVFNTNAFSAFEIIRQLCSRRIFKDGGSIVLISSITSLIARGGVCAYAASKGAINSAVRVMALELSKRRIRVNSISPGTILTPMMKDYLASLTDDEQKKRVDGFPLGLGTSDDVANGVIYLLSDAARWVTGSNLVIDGGYTAR